MATPFTFFRKNQQSLMVVLVVLAMLIFTMDSAFSSRENQFVLLGVLVGGAIFAIAGVGQGRWVQYGIGGAVFGGLAGWLLPSFTAPTNAEIVNTSLGSFDEDRLYDLGARRGIANTFMYRALESVCENQFGSDMAGQLAMQGAMRFGFGHASENEELIFTELMKAEGDDLGIEVSDQAVTEFIKNSTEIFGAAEGDGLTNEQFKKIRASMMYEGKPLRDEDLYDILKDEIKAWLAYRTLEPESSALPATPEYAYSVYRRTNVKQKLITAMLNIDDFLDQVEEPTESEIAAAFEAGKTRFPYQDGPDSLGFRQPRKVRLASLMLGRREIEESVAEVTDQDVTEYYEENKDDLYKREVTPDLSEGSDSTSGTAPEVPTIPAIPDSDGAAAPGGEESSGDEATSGDAATSGDESSADAPAAAETADPQADDPGADGDSPTEDSPGTEAAGNEGASGSDSDGTSDPALTENSEEPDGCFDEDETAGTSGDQDSVNEDGGGENPVVNSDEETASGQQSPDEPAEESGQSSTNDSQPPTLQIPESNSDAASSDEGTQLPLVIPEEGTAAAAKDENPFSEPVYEYRELDDELRDQIREDIRLSRVNEALESKMSAVMNELKKLENQRRDFRFQWFKDNPDADAAAAARDVAEFDAGMIEGMKKIGESMGLEYVDTGVFLSAEELSNSEDYPIGSAIPVTSNPFQPSSNTVQTIFGGTIDETQYYIARHYVANRFAAQMGSAAEEQHFAWWLLGHVAAHVPTLEEPGVREQVVEQLKRVKARELIEARAEELAQKVRDGLGKPENQQLSMEESLKGETSTGDADGTPVAVRETMLFSWMEIQRNNDMMNFQRGAGTPRLSVISFGDNTGDTIRYAGNDFMKEVFDGLDESEVGVVPDELRQKYYVAQVADRNFNAPNVVSEDGLRSRYLIDGTSSSGFSASSGSPVRTIARSEVASETISEWKRQVWRKYGVDPDAPPDA